MSNSQENPAVPAESEVRETREIRRPRREKVAHNHRIYT